MSITVNYVNFASHVNFVNVLFVLFVFLLLTVLTARCYARGYATVCRLSVCLYRLGTVMTLVGILCK